VIHEKESAMTSHGALFFVPPLTAEAIKRLRVIVSGIDGNSQNKKNRILFDFTVRD
jgi:hypothetical protein